MNVYIYIVVRTRREKKTDVFATIHTLLTYELHICVCAIMMCILNSLIGDKRFHCTCFKRGILLNLLTVHLFNTLN